MASQEKQDFFRLVMDKANQKFPWQIPARFESISASERVKYKKQWQCTIKQTLLDPDNIDITQSGKDTIYTVRIKNTNEQLQHTDFFTMINNLVTELLPPAVHVTVDKSFIIIEWEFESK